MDSLAQRPSGSLAFNPAKHGLVPNTPKYTCDKGKWRKYDAGFEEETCLPFTKYESISIVTASNGAEYLHVEVSAFDQRYAIRQRCDGNDGLLQLTAQTLVEGMLGQHRLNGTLQDTAGYFQAALGTKRGKSGHYGSFINVVDMTARKPTEVPKVMLDRQLDTGEFCTAVEMLSNSLYF
jgi:hypothetical protein